ncbi:hypothetical protein ACFPVY_17410 [Flavobacterium qiangtangense]|uniref:Tetratricopeptide repeat protein n=1 Tax=Flavobacterium qiangtangense TaxID=1442595 RepID=A0ABW1PSP7_9FLAO
MAILDKELQDKIDALSENAYEKFQNNEIKESFNLLEKAWLLYPEPRNQWNEAYNTAKYSFEDYMKIGDFTNANIWLDRMIDNNSNLHLSDFELEHNEAKYLFETGDYAKAFEKWKYVVKEAGLRYFEEEDSKYKNFYKNKGILK